MKWCLRSVGFVILLANGWDLCEGAVCPEGWKGHKSSCYYFSNAYLTWIQAFDQCKELHGGYLVEIEDYDENAFISSVLRSKTYYYYNIGLSDQDAEGSWKWMTSGKHLNFSYWSPGEPNNQDDDEDCAMFFTMSRWNDDGCLKLFRYICEKATSECFDSPCINGGTCKDGINNYTCDCVAGYEGRNCQDHVNACLSNPCINGGTCNDGVNSYKCDCTIGYVGTNCQNKSTAVTCTGKASVPVYVFAAVVSVLVLLIVTDVVLIIIWRKWYISKSNSVGENQTTANSIQGTTETETTKTAIQFRRARRLRLGNASETCPTGWTLYLKGCYKFNQNSSDWISAQERSSCSDDGGNLVDTTSNTKNAFVVSFRDNFDDTRIWIGLKGTHNTYMWASGSVFNFTNWASGQPSDPTSDESCVEMWQSGMWNDLECQFKRPYVCERSVIERCPAGWTINSNNCYSFSTSSSDWFSAKSSCRNDGGNLVDITSSAKNEVIDSFRDSINKTNIWLGLRGTHNTYTWISGSVFNFTNWASGLPSDPISDESCVEMWQSGKWNDLECHFKRHYVCERSVIV